jgi:hypothetical protein
MKKLITFLVTLLILNSSFLIRNCMSQWQPDVRLTNDPASSFTSFNNAWCVALSGSVVHVVWSDLRDSNNEIYYKRSTDAGVNWGTDTRLTSNSSDSRYPSVAVSGSVIHVVWYDNRDGNNEIYYKRSTDAGVSWGADTRLTNNTGNSQSPSVAVTGSVVHIAWEDNRNANYDIYYKRSSDGGISWGTDVRMTNNNSSYSASASITVSGSVVHVVWYDNRDGNQEIYYKRSTDAGISWGADVRLTNNTGASYFPSVAVSGSVVHVVWIDGRDGNNEIYCKRSTDAGLSWGADTRLTNNTAYSFYPSIAVSGSVVHVIWEDYRDGNYEIYYKSSLDEGVSWGTDTRLTNNTADSFYPSIAVSSSVVHVVWLDIRDGNWEIYYKRNPTGNPIGIQNISTEIPSSYSLSQNYPNPFNPTTIISFQLSLAGQVVLKVYDVMGREVQTLVNESLKPGTYEASFDGSSLNSGVYFYRLTTENYSETKKMILMK